MHEEGFLIQILSRQKVIDVKNSVPQFPLGLSSANHVNEL